MSDTPGLLMLYNLLSRASTLPCSGGTGAFLSLLTNEDDWLSLAIDGFLPALQNQNLQIPQRILAAYVLYALYKSHDHGTIPFHEYLLRIFESERAIALAASRVKPYVGSAQLEDMSGIRARAKNESLVWVLWKLLREESDDLAPYSPNMLSRTTIPENFRPVHLVAHGISEYGDANRISSLQPLSGSANSVPGPTGANTSFFNSGYSIFQRSSHMPVNTAPEKPPLKTTFSPFDDTDHDSGTFHLQGSSAGQMPDADVWGQNVPTNFRSRRSPQQPSPSCVGSRNVSAFSQSTLPEMNFDHLVGMSHTPLHLRANEVENQRREHLSQTITVEPYMQNSLGPPPGGMQEKFVNMNGDVRMFSHLEPHLQLSILSRPHPLPHRTASRSPTQFHSGLHNPRPRSVFDGFPATSGAPIGQRPSPISRPQSRTPSQYAASPTTGTSASAAQLLSGNELKPQSHAEVTQSYPKPFQQTWKPVDENSQQAFGIPFAQQRRASTPAGVHLPPRSPGVIGSGRPSSSVFRRVISNHTGEDDRPGPVADDSSRSYSIPPIGDLGESSAPRDRGMLEHRNMIPFSVLCMQSGKEWDTNTQLSSLGELENGRSDGREHGGDKSPGLDGELASLSLGQKEQQVSTKINIGITPSNDTTCPPNHGEAEHAPLLSPSADLRPQVPSDRRLPSEEHHPTTNTASVEPPQACPASSLSSSTHPIQLKPSPNNPQAPSECLREQENVPEAKVDEKEHNELTHAIILLLSARERVLTLSEQRMLHPHLLTLAQPISLLPPQDLPLLIAKNPDIAAKLLVFILDRRDEDAVNIEQLLRDVSKNDLIPSEGETLAPTSSTSHDNSMTAVDAVQAAVKFINTCGAPSEANGSSSEVSPFGGPEAKEAYLYALRKLPPTIQSFNIIAKLLNPTTVNAVSTTQLQDSPEVRVATLIRIEVLGGFVSRCVSWIEGAERQAKEGEVHDDRVAVAISNLCRFYSFLLRHGFVSAASEADTAEIMSFALQFSRFEEATSLYSTLVAGRV